MLIVFGSIVFKLVSIVLVLVKSWWLFAVRHVLLDRIYRLVQLCILPVVVFFFLAEITQLLVNFMVAIIRDDLHLVDVAAAWA